MTKLSTGQVRTLEMIGAATDRGSPFIAPKGPSGRPAKFLKNAELIEWREVAGCPPYDNGGYWITPTGREELARMKSGAKT